MFKMWFKGINRVFFRVFQGSFMGQLKNSFKELSGECQEYFKGCFRSVFKGVCSKLQRSVSKKLLKCMEN